MNRPHNARLLRRAVLVTASLVLLYFLAILVYGTANDYQPEEQIALRPLQSADRQVVQDSILSFFIWNLGFGGLGRESDFFYEDGYFFFSGGRSTRTPIELVRKNVDGILRVSDSLKSDFYLFQEVDEQSKRSYFIDQVDALGNTLTGYCGIFAVNFNVPYVPIPVLEPWHAYGKAYSGLASYSRFEAVENIRYQLPGNFSWPKSAFSLDRCLSLQRFAVAGGRELVVVNLHHSAYDKDGSLKAQQLAYLRDLLLPEYEKGNYVITGGDWNMCPPYFRFDGYMPGQSGGHTQQNIPDDLFPPDWLWIYDAALPTNRKTRRPYKRGETFVTLIDFFLVSPNVTVRQVKTVDLDFEYSDHQPVWMEIELKR